MVRIQHVQYTLYCVYPVYPQTYQTRCLFDPSHLSGYGYRYCGVVGIKTEGSFTLELFVFAKKLSVSEREFFPFIFNVL